MIKREGTQGSNYYKDESIEKWRYHPYRKKNRQIAEESYATNNILPFPLHLIVEVSSLCQLKCGFCNREVMTRKQQNMDMETFTKIVDEAAANGVYSLSLYCLGEPFLNPLLRDMIIYAKRMGIPYVDVSTNGMLPMLSVLGTGLNEIIVSIDGQRRTHESLRLGSNWDYVVMNTEKLRKERDRNNHTAPLIRIQCIDLWETREEVKENSEFIDWAFGLGDVVYIKNVEAFSQNLGAKNLPQTEIARRIAERKPCKQLWFCLTIDSTGEIEYCCHSPKGEAKLGNIGTVSLKKTWDSLAEIRENHKNGTYTDICKNCTDYSW